MPAEVSAMTPPAFFKGQRLHFAALSGLLIVVGGVWMTLGHPVPLLFWAAVAVPIVHQVFVWLAWRSELRHASVSRTIGFRGYLILFFLLFGARFVTLALLAFADRGTLPIDPEVRLVLTLALLVPGGYAIYSVQRYFGMARAAGADHFDPQYRSMPLVKQGIFRFTNNGMYLYAFALFWAIALGFASFSGLVVAAFSHAYIWVHFYATERPDMRYLYGNPSR